MEMDKITTGIKGDKSPEPELEIKTEGGARPEDFFTVQNIYTEAAFGHRPDKSEEGPSNLYSTLTRPSEDVYGVAHVGGSTDKRTRLYRAGCVVFSVVCLVLLLVIIVLSLRRHPEPDETEADLKSSRLDTTTSSSTREATGLGCTPCGPKWLIQGQSCFYLSTIRMTWEMSQRECFKKGGSLAVITGQEVQWFLTLKGNVNYWIGLRLEGSKWSWVTSADLQQSYWAENVSGGDCAILDANLPPERSWIRDSCKALGYFICQVQF